MPSFSISKSFHNIMCNSSSTLIHLLSENGLYLFFTVVYQEMPIIWHMHQFHADIINKRQHFDI